MGVCVLKPSLTRQRARTACSADKFPAGLLQLRTSWDHLLHVLIRDLKIFRNCHISGWLVVRGHTDKTTPKGSRNRKHPCCHARIRFKLILSFPCMRRKLEANREGQLSKGVNEGERGRTPFSVRPSNAESRRIQVGETRLRSQWSFPLLSYKVISMCARIGFGPPL